MFGRTKPPQGPPETPQPPSQPAIPAASKLPVGYETVIGANTSLKGDLKSRANVRIDGTLEGGLDVEGSVMVGETAKVTANIQAKNEVKVAGAVRGNINARKVHMARTGRVWGDISAVTLVTDEGAYIEGKIAMTGHPAGAQGFSNALPPPDLSLLPGDTHGDGESVDAELIDGDPRERDGKEH
ncbi:MAG: polymer-forming cytoskeletal protein [Anaerolinea sp.]|nr:polymer-forming cytoskeletal protein [Anaerolinea sp.]